MRSRRRDHLRDAMILHGQLLKAATQKLTARYRAQVTRTTRKENRERGTAKERERRWKLVVARNSCDLMGFFDYYLMPIAIQPIHTPLTYTGGIRKNRGLSPRRAILACADFLPADQRMEEGSDVCEIPAIVDLTRIINRTPGCFPRMRIVLLSLSTYYYRGISRYTRCTYQIANSS